MNMSTFEPLTIVKVWFWRSMAYGTEWAVQHRTTVYHALRIAPIVTAALFAFMLGRLVGALLGLAIY
jgi:hypothetical protein